MYKGEHVHRVKSIDPIGPISDWKQVPSSARFFFFSFLFFFFFFFSIFIALYLGLVVGEKHVYRKNGLSTRPLHIIHVIVFKYIASYV